MNNYFELHFFILNFLEYNSEIFLFILIILSKSSLDKQKI